QLGQLGKRGAEIPPATTVETGHAFLHVGDASVAVPFDLHPRMGAGVGRREDGQHRSVAGQRGGGRECRTLGCRPRRRRLLGRHREVAPLGALDLVLVFDLAVLPFVVVAPFAAPSFFGVPLAGPLPRPSPAGRPSPFPCCKLALRASIKSITRPAGAAGADWAGAAARRSSTWASTASRYLSS